MILGMRSSFSGRHLTPAQIIASFNPLADYRFTEGAGSTCADSSGNGRTMTRNGNNYWDNNGIRFYVNGATATVPAAVGSAFKTVMLYVSSSVANTNPYTHLLHTNSVDQYIQLYQQVDYTEVHAKTQGNSSFLVRPYPFVLGVSMPDAAAEIHTINGVAPANQFGTATTPARSGTFTLAPSADVNMWTAMYLPTALTVGQMRTLAAAIAEREAARVALGTQQPVSTALFNFSGDSRGQALDLTAVGMPTVRTYNRYNYAISGNNTTQISNIFTDSKYLWRTLAAKNLALIWGGVNDVASIGDGAAGTWSRIAACATSLKALGYHVGVCTEISSTIVPGWEGPGIKQQLNALILNGVSAGTIDSVCRLDLTVLGPDGAMAPVNGYSADGLHPNASANSTIVQPAIGAWVDARG
jgi:hypothetical protein